MIVGFAAGGGNDIFARLVGQKLSELLGQTVVIENRPAAGGRSSAEYVANQPADGYTLLVGASGMMSIAAAVYPESALPSDQELHPALDDRELSADHVGAGEQSGEVRERAGGLGQAASRQGELRHHVSGLHDHDRAAQAQDRNAGRGDPLEEQRPRCCSAW